jgi:hypothetical protein
METTETSTTLTIALIVNDLMIPHHLPRKPRTSFADPLRVDQLTTRHPLAEHRAGSQRSSLPVQTNGGTDICSTMMGRVHHTPKIMSGQSKKSWRAWTHDSRLWAAIVVLAIPSVAGRAQVGHLWTFDELATKANCVVIAEHLRTQDTGRRTTHPELAPSYPVVELETALKLLAVLKPCSQTALKIGTTITLKHYTPDRERIDGGLLDGGSVLTFSPGAAYLMFLKLSGGGVFEPVSGHTYPTASVYRVPKPVN